MYKFYISYTVYFSGGYTEQVETVTKYSAPEQNAAILTENYSCFADFVRIRINSIKHIPALKIA